METKTKLISTILGIALVMGCEIQDNTISTLTDEMDPQDVENDGARVTVGQTDMADMTIWAGQNIMAGMVFFDNEDNILTVNYQTTGGWELVETHFAIGCSLADIPVNRKGNPQVGLFPYHSGDLSGKSNYTFTIDLSTFPCGFDCGTTNKYQIAAHAVVRRPDGNGGYQTETGWCEGSAFVQKGNWAMFNSINVICDEDPEPDPETCETSFAYDEISATCFLDIDEDNDGKKDFNRWGWTNSVNEPGNYTYQMYAGAGQCEISKGTHVGTVTINYNGSTAQVLVTTLKGFYMDEAHYYVGNSLLPVDKFGKFTVAPGQFPGVHDLSKATSDTYEISVSGSIYVVVHAVVCGVYAN